VRHIILATLLLGGCASVTNPTNERRVTEYGAGAALYGGQGVIGGCRLVQEGETDGCLRYQGPRCSYSSPACPELVQEQSPEPEPILEPVTPLPGPEAPQPSSGDFVDPDPDS